MYIFLLLFQKKLGTYDWQPLHFQCYIYLFIEVCAEFMSQVNLNTKWRWPWTGLRGLGRLAERSSVWWFFSSLKEKFKTSSTRRYWNQFHFFGEFFTLRKVMKQWQSGLVCFWSVSSATHLGGPRPLCFSCTCGHCLFWLAALRPSVITCQSAKLVFLAL